MAAPAPSSTMAQRSKRPRRFANWLGSQVGGAHETEKYREQARELSEFASFARFVGFEFLHADCKESQCSNVLEECTGWTSFS